MKTMNIGVYALSCVLLSMTTSTFAQDRTPLAGCDCPAVRLDDAWCAASLVFEGVPISSDTIFTVGNELPYPRNPIDHENVLFKVVRTLKGETGPEVIISTARGRDNCSYRFIFGTHYMVFASKDGDLMVTDQCTPTRPMDVIGQSFKDSLEFVRSGHQWEGHVPLNLPCQ